MAMYRLKAEATAARKGYTGHWFPENCKSTLDRLAKQANEDNPGRNHWVDKKEGGERQ